MVLGFWKLAVARETVRFVLADAVGERGWVDAVDPGSPDYGILHLELPIN
jgi:hypothetical protein